MVKWSGKRKSSPDFLRDQCQERRHTDIEELDFQSLKISWLRISGAKEAEAGKSL